MHMQKLLMREENAEERAVNVDGHESFALLIPTGVGEGHPFSLKNAAGVGL